MTEPANLDPYGRPLGGQLERDGRLLAAAQCVDLTAGHCDNASRTYWYQRAAYVHARLRAFGRGDDVDLTLSAAAEREERAVAEARPHDDEPTDGTVFVVEAAQVGAIYATTTDARARTWIRDEGAATYGADNLGITALAVERG